MTYIDVMPTKHIKRVGLLTGACLAIAVLVSVLCFGSKPPLYSGHPLGYWFNELPMTFVSAGTVGSAEQMDEGGRKYGSQREKHGVSLAAIRNIGTQGLPYLIRKLERRETPIEHWAQTCAFKCGAKRLLFPNREVQRAQAVTALLALSPLPPDAISKLRFLSKNSTNSVGLSAAYLLRASTNTSFNIVTTRYQ
jgi:hypothetical protein